jgi:hypothetical protein
VTAPPRSPDDCDVPGCPKCAENLKDAIPAPPRCPTCGHAKNRHDPEDGTCDAPAEVGLGVCPCGRAPAAPPRSSAGSCHDHGNCELCDQQEAEIARLLAVIEALPHEDDCETKYSHRPCNCAKSKAVAK